LRYRHCGDSNSYETSGPVGSFANQMKWERKDISVAEFDAMDRRVIQVEIPPAHAGITAALRRAFEAAAAEPCDRDFAELLRRLN
jgi:hypothetical protein